jgi:hypothetical protein
MFNDKLRLARRDQARRLLSAQCDTLPPPAEYFIIPGDELTLAIERRYRDVRPEPDTVICLAYAGGLAGQGPHLVPAAHAAALAGPIADALQQICLLGVFGYLATVPCWRPSPLTMLCRDVV